MQAIALKNRITTPRVFGSVRRNTNRGLSRITVSRITVSRITVSRITVSRITVSRITVCPVLPRIT